MIEYISELPFFILKSQAGFEVCLDLDLCMPFGGLPPLTRTFEISKMLSQHAEDTFG